MNEYKRNRHLPEQQPMELTNEGLQRFADIIHATQATQMKSTIVIDKV